jgi:hypothetical protein
VDLLFQEINNQIYLNLRITFGEKLDEKSVVSIFPFKPTPFLTFTRMNDE